MTDQPTPKPPGPVLPRRGDKRRRPKLIDYAERGLAELHLESVTARIAEGRELFIQQRRGLDDK